jgi:ligand-binding sensor domain-containing protein
VGGSAGWAFGLAVSPSGQVWDGDDAQCSRLDPDDPALGFWSPFAEVIDVWPSARDRSSRIVIAEDGTLYVSSWANGLAIRSARGAFSFLGIEDGLPSQWVSGVRPDPDGTLWVGSLRGLGRWDAVQRRWRYYTKASGLPADVVWTVAVERTSTGRAVWIGTTGGVARFDGP